MDVQQWRMSCRELVELITDYLEGKLPAAERERFEEHLAMCEWCMDYLEQMKLTIKSAGTLREEDISEEAKAGLLDAFRSWKSRQ